MSIFVFSFFCLGLNIHSGICLSTLFPSSVAKKLKHIVLAGEMPSERSFCADFLAIFFYGFSGLF